MKSKPPGLYTIIYSIICSPSTIILMPHCWSSAACHLPRVCHQIWVNHLLFPFPCFSLWNFPSFFCCNSLIFFKNKFTYSFLLLHFFLFSDIPKIHLYSFTCYKPLYLFGNLHLNNNFRPILSKCLNLILKFETTHFHNFIKCLIVVFNFFFFENTHFKNSIF